MAHVHARLRRLVVATVTVALVIPAFLAVSPTPAQAGRACTRTITGTHNGNLAVAGGKRLCLRNAVQRGNIAVAPNGGLSVVGSRVVGAISLDSGFTAFKFCDSKTTQAISAVGGGGVNIGGGKGCGGNVIGGALSLSANNAGLTVKRSRVDGAMTVSDTTGTVVIARNRIADALTLSATTGTSTLSGNTIAGALTCSNNTPDPVNGGERNSVAGARTGETCLSETF